MPKDMSEEALARWMLAIECCGLESITEAAIVEELRLSPYPAIARAVLALCEAKVREACEFYADSDDFDAMDAEAIERIVARVMGKEAT